MVRLQTAVLLSVLACVLGWVASALWHRDTVIQPRDLDSKYVIEPRFNKVVAELRAKGIDADPEMINWLTMCLLSRTPERRILKIPYHRLSELDAQVLLQIALDAARSEDERENALTVLSVICFGRGDVCTAIAARAKDLVEANNEESSLMSVLLLLQMVWMGEPDDQFTVRVNGLGRSPETKRRVAKLRQQLPPANKPDAVIDIGTPGIDANTVPRHILHNGRNWIVVVGGFPYGNRGKADRGYSGEKRPGKACTEGRGVCGDSVKFGCRPAGACPYPP